MKELKKWILTALLAFVLGIFIKSITVNIGQEKFMFCRTLEPSIIEIGEEKTEY